MANECVSKYMANEWGSKYMANELGSECIANEAGLVPWGGGRAPGKAILMYQSL